MKTLTELVSGLDIVKIDRNRSIKISSIAFDSRLIKKNSLFVAVKGALGDGHKFIDEAIRNGVSVIVYEKKPLKKYPNITYIQVKDSRQALTILANNFYDYPSKKLKLIGVTGTNGKTTTASLLFNLFRNLGYSCALLSTIENKINNQSYPATHTTPDPIALNAFLSQALKKDCKYAFMECSSHAIDQKRIWGLEFTGAIFTNLTQDHLDYHKTMRAYAKAKKTLFDDLPAGSFAVVNQDDPWGEYMVSGTRVKKYFFSLKKKEVRQSLRGIEILWDNKILKSKLIGYFNACNLMGVYVTALLLNISEKKTLAEIKKLDPPSGRLEFLKSKKGVTGILDYAHTPDALEKALKTIRKITPKNNKIITVVGCGGDRDKSKRPIMGQIAYQLSDYVVFSSDNPRNEEPGQILRNVVMNLPPQNNKYECEIDRAKAINIAFKYAKIGDVVLLAGKGHEDYQVLKEGKIHFSEKEIWKKITK